MRLERAWSHASRRRDEASGDPQTLFLKSGNFWNLEWLGSWHFLGLSLGMAETNMLALTFKHIEKNI